MLGVRRAGVTVALHSFEQRGLSPCGAASSPLSTVRHRESGGQLLRHAEAELKRLMSEVA